MNKIKIKYSIATLRLLSEMAKTKSKKINRNHKFGLEYIKASISYAMVLIRKGDTAEALLVLKKIKSMLPRNRTIKSSIYLKDNDCFGKMLPGVVE